MKKALASVLLLSALTACASNIGTADKIYHLTHRESGIVCAIDVHVRDSGVIKTDTHCFLTK